MSGFTLRSIDGELASGLARRTYAEGGPIDETLRKDMTWRPDSAIAEWEYGDLSEELVKISDVAKNPFRVEYVVVNLDALEAFEGTELDPDVFRASGLSHKHGLIKVLGRGELTRAMNVSAHGFSASAKAAIEAAGGTVHVVPPPFGNGRPPAKGNALTNR